MSPVILQIGFEGENLMMNAYDAELLTAEIFIGRCKYAGALFGSRRRRRVHGFEECYRRNDCKNPDEPQHSHWESSLLRMRPGFFVLWRFVEENFRVPRIEILQDAALNEAKPFA